MMSKAACLRRGPASGRDVISLRERVRGHSAGQHMCVHVGAFMLQLQGCLGREIGGPIRASPRTPLRAFTRAGQAPFFPLPHLCRQSATRSLLSQLSPFGRVSDALVLPLSLAQILAVAAVNPYPATTPTPHVSTWGPIVLG